MLKPNKGARGEGGAGSAPESVSFQLYCQPRFTEGLEGAEADVQGEECYVSTAVLFRDTGGNPK